MAARETAFVLKPENVSFERAAAVPVAAITALQGLRDKGRLQAGQQVLINGASGGVGTFAVQIAMALGAEVTAVCHTRNVEMASRIGADHVIDCTTADFTKGAPRYDVILDIAGNHSLSAIRQTLSPTGIHVLVGGDAMLSMRRAGWLKLTRNQRAVFYVAQLNKPDLFVLREFLASGVLNPVIDRTFPLREAGDAYRYMGTGHARGKIVITV